MARAFDKSTVSLTALTAHRVSDLLVAEGYTGRMVGAFLEIEDAGGLGDVYHGDDNAVDATTGRLLTLFTRSATPGAAVDPSRYWVYSTGGGDISITFEPK